MSEVKIYSIIYNGGIGNKVVQEEMLKEKTAHITEANE